jgi:hypothetical protein
MVLIAVPTYVLAQTGPWARYDAKMKGDALYRDASAGDLESVKSIVAGGGDVNWTLPQTNSTPIMGAAKSSNPEVVRFLLEQGANPAAKDWWDMTACDHARQMGDRNVLRVFAEFGLDAKCQRAAAPAAEPARPAAPAAAAPAARPAAPAARPAAPAARPAAPVAPKAATPRAPARASATAWDPFGTYAVGERVMFHAPNGWFTGVVAEVGASTGSGWNAKKYRIVDDRFGGGGDWFEYGRVARPARAPFWTGFFVGDWGVGEVMAVNTRSGTVVDTTEYAYHGASESLRVEANGTYTWRTTGGRVIRGRWQAATDGPGVVLRRAVDGRDWTLRNETNAIEEDIRKLETARLTTPGKMSIAAKRPMPRSGS